MEYPKCYAYTINYCGWRIVDEYVFCGDRCYEV